ncbi:MAG: tRNA preQ1(34) S-adenosylmethionine ribosyltransferase-isomerase QueA [Clostridiales bacterium]|nr:tRNA preQ1(34) S-adenosylmethionine ribosyltransferase-isomerase QueA [Clostridiales bacterium]
MVKTSDFYYDLPQELIAQTPIEPRDHSRMLVYHREDQSIEHLHFYDLPRFLQKGDVLAVNETKVIPARLLGVKEETGVPVEILLLKRKEKDVWEAIVRPGRRLMPGVFCSFGDGLLRAEILSTTEDGGRMVRFHYEGVFEELLDQLGQMPLPPYIHEKLQDPSRYQTVYAKQEGSAAAPTAGLHFTPEILDKIQQMGVDIAPVLLHVGLGTFRPVKVDDISKHHMHVEHYEVHQEIADQINAARQAGGRCVCVGTTSVRTLESVTGTDGIVKAGCGETDIFITPGYQMRATDALLTNFHLPESTLLMLVSAMMGRDEVLRIYQEAVKMQYRFFSFGDCMLIL